MIGKRLFWSVFWIGVYTAVLGAAAGQGQQLKYYSESDRQYGIGDIVGYCSLTIIEKAPEGIQLPKFVNNRPLYAQWRSPRVKKGYLWIGLDRSESKGPYNRLFIDANNDGHLIDETAVTANWISSDSATFGPVEIAWTGEEGPFKYHLNFEFFDYGDTRGLTAYSSGQYEGTITVGQERKYCVLIDYNANGTFNDTAPDARQSDRIAIGKQESWKSSKVSYVGNFIEVEGQLYQLEVAQNGSGVELAPAQGVSFGVIRLPEYITEFTAGGANGLFTLKPEKGPRKLPVGKYRMVQWTMEQPDEKGDLWKLQGSEFDSRGDFEVAPEKEITLTVGEPITCGLEIINTGPGTYTLTQILKGQLGENILLLRNSALPGDLIINVKSPDGSYVKTEYLEDA